MIAVFFTNLFDVLTPLALKMGIDALEHSSEKNSADALLRAVGIYFALMVGVTIFRYLWRIYFGRFQHAVADDLRQRIFTRLSTLGASFYNRTPVGQLLSLITNDVNTFRMAIGPGMLILLDAFFYIIMIVPLMILLSWDWTWKSLIILPIVPFFMRKMENLIHHSFRAQQDRLSEMSGRAAEIVSGIRPIKSFAQEANQSASFDLYSRRFEEACNRVTKIDSAFHPAMQFPVTVGTVILLWFCTPEVMRGEITLGTFVAFHEYIKRMVWPMSAIGMGISMMEQGRASFARIWELLQTETDIPNSGRERPGKFEALVVHELSFRYQGAKDDALKDISFRLNAGETIGLVGPVGSGKSTLLHLLCRMYPAKPGEIRINGIDLHDILRSELNQKISLVHQEAFLFSETIFANVALGLSEDPRLEQITSAVSLVNMDQEIQKMPSAYSAFIGERGVNLSGGQKQRLTIARALIRNSPIVMLDDSLSAVDGKTEQSIVRAIRERRAAHPEQAAILVSHRLATLKHADRIIVLNQGRIEAEGSHLELLEKSATYRHMHDLQSTSTDESSLWSHAPELGAAE